MPIKSTKTKPKVVTKTIVEFTQKNGMEYFFTVQGEGKDATIFMGESYDYEDEMLKFDAEVFLDAVIAMFPENVAYQFPDED